MVLHQTFKMMFQVKKKNASPTVNAFMSALNIWRTRLMHQIKAFFSKTHQESHQDRKLKKYGINIQAFLNQKHLDVPTQSSVESNNSTSLCGFV